jgi:hypothetical protein
MKKILITLLLCALSLPVLASDVTKTLKAGIEKNSSYFTDFFIYEEFLKDPKTDKGHAFEVFGYNANKRIMCNLFVVNLPTNKPAIIFDNTKDNICFSFNYVNYGKTYYADRYDSSNGYFNRISTLAFKDNFEKIETFKNNIDNTVIQWWQGKRSNYEKLEREVLKSFK